MYNRNIFRGIIGCENFKVRRLIELKSNKEQKNTKLNRKEKGSNKYNDNQMDENVPAQKDGFRYDYNDNI